MAFSELEFISFDVGISRQRYGFDRVAGGVSELCRPGEFAHPIGGSLLHDVERFTANGGNTPMSVRVHRQRPPLTR